MVRGRWLLAVAATAAALAGCGDDPAPRAAAPAGPPVRPVPTATVPAAPTPTPTPTPVPAPRRPRIEQRRIPMPAARLAELRAFNRRHYGVDSARLRHPKLIVEHYTVTEALQPVINFWSDWRTPAEGVYPKTCAHFVVDRDGRIVQTVGLGLTCRQGLGVGYTSIAIEHVGMSDREVLSDRRQMRSSLRLTRWLQARYGISTRNVIGHAEVPRSRYFRDLAPGLPAHSDMQPPAMRRYRRWLRRAARTGAVGGG